VIVVDEIDKAGGDAQYDPLGSLYTLLEHDTAAEFVDEFAEVPIDASDVVWIATANDSRSIPEPILNRMNVYAIDAPDEQGARRIARSIYEELRSEHAWGKVFPDELTRDCLDRLARMKPREMRRLMLAGFGNAKLAGRDEVLPEDITEERVARKPRIGF
jgi:ATP-dependent Lon protease